MSYQYQIESIERRERSKADNLDDSFSAKCCSIVIGGICILPIPLGSVLLIAGIFLIEWPTSDDISDIDDTEKDGLRYLLKL